MSYDAIIEEIHSLDYENKLELKTLLEKFLIEDRRNEIARHHKDVIKMADNNELIFSSNTDELLSMLEQQ